MERKAKGGRINIRVLIHKETGRILYAEAGKDFVDLLLGFLLLPSGSVIQVLSESGISDSVGCITNLYDSVDQLHSLFMKTDKSILLEPKVSSIPSNNILRIQSVQSDPPRYYVCRYTGSYGSNAHCIKSERGQRCSCGNTTDIEVKMGDHPPSQAADSPSTSNGFVKKGVTFIITDDLKITPTSAITGLSLLHKLHVKSFAELEERNLPVGFDQALRLLRASLVSRSALNDVFGDRTSGIAYGESRGPAPEMCDSPPDLEKPQAEAPVELCSPEIVAVPLRRSPSRVPSREHMLPLKVVSGPGRITV